MDEDIPHHTLRYKHLSPTFLAKWNKAYTEKDVFSETSDSIHEMTRTGKAYISTEYEEGPSYNPTVNDWRLILNLPISQVPKGKGMELYGFGIKLSYTPPHFFGPLFDGKILQDRADTRAWAAANQVFGTGWKTKPPPLLTQKLDQMQISPAKTPVYPPNKPN